LLPKLVIVKYVTHSKHDSLNSLEELELKFKLVSSRLPQLVPNGKQEH